MINRENPESCLANFGGPTLITLLYRMNIGLVFYEYRLLQYEYYGYVLSDCMRFLGCRQNRFLRISRNSSKSSHQMAFELCYK